MSESSDSFEKIEFEQSASPPTNDQQSADLITNDQHSSSEIIKSSESSESSESSKMASSTDQAKPVQLKDLEFELAWKTREEIICGLTQHTALLSGLIFRADVREKMRKANNDLVTALMNLPVKGGSRSKSFESPESRPDGDLNEVVLDLSWDMKSRIVDTLITNHHVVLLEAVSVSSEDKAKFIDHNNDLACELLKLRARTVAVSGDPSVCKGDHLIDLAAKTSKSQTTSNRAANEEKLGEMVKSRPSTKQTANQQTSTGIDDLPPEMICELFEYLPLQDLLVCSMVNKRWNSIYAGFKVHRLVAGDWGKWYPNQTIPEVDMSMSMFVHFAEKPLFSNLKHLVLSDYVPGFDLNRFQQLVHLEISIYLTGTIRLNLPRLNVLAFQDNSNGNCSLSIDCPLLSTLVYYSTRDLLEVKQPETIRKLDTNMFGEELVPFKNVECLVTREFKAINKATLQSLPKLRELRHTVCIQSVFWREAHNGAGVVDRMKRTLSEFLDEAKKLRGSDFRFSFSGFQLTNVKLDQIDFGVSVRNREHEWVSNEYFYMKNYHLIEPGALHFIDGVDYTRLLSHVTGEFPRCFSKKFSGIEWVKATAEVQDADQFLLFLKSLRFLRSLVLEETGFSQEFYDQLPASVHSLGNLELRDGHCKSDLQLNFDFIGELSSLSWLTIYSALSLESLPSLVRPLGKLKGGAFDVQLREECFYVHKQRNPSEWAIRKADKVLFKTKNPNEIVNFFKDLQGDQL